MQTNPDRPLSAWETDSGLHLSVAVEGGDVFHPVLNQGSTLYKRFSNQNVNTVEVVKKNGKYSVVIDGVAQTEIQGSDARYNLVRFKESNVTQEQRVVHPVVVAMRLEEGEIAPETCVLRVTRHVQDNGVVLAGDEELGQYTIKPYSIGGTTCEALTLPYPSISTPEPHFDVIDHERERIIEATLSIPRDKYEMYGNVSKKVILDDTEREKRRKASKKAQDDIKELSKNAGEDVEDNDDEENDQNYVPGEDGEEDGEEGDEEDGEEGDEEGDEEDGEEDGDEGDEEDGEEGDEGDNVNIEIGGGGDGGENNVFTVTIGTSNNQDTLDVVEWWEAFQSKTFKQTLNREGEQVKEEVDALVNKYIDYTETEPEVYRIDVSEVPRLLKRIKNGNPKNSRKTIQYLKKPEERAFLKWLISVSDEDTEFNTRKQELDNRDKRSLPFTGNTIDRGGMNPRALCATTAQISYTVNIQERDGTYGPTIHITATNVNGYDAGWVASPNRDILSKIQKEANSLVMSLEEFGIPVSVLGYKQSVRSYLAERLAIPTDPEILDAQRKRLLERVKKIVGIDWQERLSLRLGELESIQSETKDQLSNHLSCDSDHVPDVLLFRHAVIYENNQRRVLKDAFRDTLSSCIVPVLEWKTEDQPKKVDEVLRILPQIVSHHKSSSRGVAKIATKRVDSEMEFKEGSRSVQTCIGRLQEAMLNAEMYDLSKMLIFQGGLTTEAALHFVQVYQWHEKWKQTFKESQSSLYAFTSGTFATAPLLPPDMLTMSSLPTTQTTEDMLLAEEAGGSTLKSKLRAVSGTRDRKGVYKMLVNAGCEPSIGGLMAAATFCEIFALQHTESATATDDQLAGPETSTRLRASQLVVSIYQRVARSARVVAAFLQQCAHESSISITHNDVAFHCLPDMRYVKIALKLLGVVQSNTNNSVYTELTRTKRALAHTMAKSLIGMASKQTPHLQSLPFLCLQSFLPALPEAINGPNRNVAAEQIRELVHSYGRVVTATNALVQGAKKDASKIDDVNRFKSHASVLRIDCLNSRPILLQAMKENASAVKVAIFKASNDEYQKDWKVPKGTLGNVILRHRLAATRVDAGCVMESKREAVWTKDYGYGHLVDEMTKLDICTTTEHKKPVSANFMIPFGMYAMGTPLDVAHMGFEFRPVWVSVLMDEAQALSLCQTQPDGKAMVLLEGRTVNGKPRNPQSVTVWQRKDGDNEKIVISVYAARALAHSSTIPTTTNMCSKLFEQTSTLLGATDVVKSGKIVCGGTNPRAGAYKNTAHNAERIFQAGCILASRIYTHIPERGAAATLSISAEAKGHTSLSNATVSACVGNALSFCATRVNARVAPVGREEDICATASKIIDVCKALKSDGVQAIPVFELCACLSIL